MFASKDKDALKVQADEEIQAAEDVIDKVSADSLPSVGYKGKLAYPDNATDKYTSVDVEF